MVSKLLFIEKLLLKYDVERRGDTLKFKKKISIDQKKQLFDDLNSCLYDTTLENERVMICEFLLKLNRNESIPILLNEFKIAENYRWEYGDMLYRTAHRNYVKEYIELASDRSLGADRQMIVLIFGKLKIIEAKELLLSLLEDDTVYGHALESLSKIDDGSLLPIFYNFYECGTTWIRNVAIKHIREQKITYWTGME